MFITVKGCKKGLKDTVDKQINLQHVIWIGKDEFEFGVNTSYNIIIQTVIDKVVVEFNTKEKERDDQYNRIDNKLNEYNLQQSRR